MHRPHIDRVYPYHYRDGEVAYEVVRMEPKGFYQRRSDGKNGYINDLKDVRRVLYHLRSMRRTIKEADVEQADDVRNTIGMKEVYAMRKETIERVFADAKEKHGMRYTQYKGRAA